MIQHSRASVESKPLGPYASAAYAYRDAGWAGVVPLPARQKHPPEKGYTGASGVDPDEEQIDRWIAQDGARNLALRMPDGVIGIDVDAYPRKRGAETLRAALSAWGPLGPTWRSSSREDDGVSGIRFYRVPPGVRLRGVVRVVDGRAVADDRGDSAADVEIVQRHHRYAVVAPSIHPRGHPYCWWRPDGSRRPPHGPLPSPGELPMLPERWLDALRVEDGRPARAERVPRGQHEILTGGQACSTVAQVLRDACAGCVGGSRHDNTLHDVLRLVRLGEQGHRGTEPALRTLRGAFIAALSGDRGGQGEAEAEFDRMLDGALVRVCDDPTPADHAGCRCGDAAVSSSSGPTRVQRTEQSAALVAAGTYVSDVEREEIEWVWPGRIARGKLTLIDGDPGLGKSVLTLDMAARITTGTDWPDGHPCAEGGVVLLSAEDGLADTIRPRLDEAGADTSRVLALDQVGDDPHAIVLPGDLEHVKAAIARIARERGIEVRLVVVDPLAAFLSGDVNMHRDQDVRRALRPLAGLADRLRVAVVVIRHLNKSQGAPTIYRGGGSIGIVGAARIGLLVGADPEDEGRLVLAAVKDNLAAKPTALTYRIQDAHGVARVAWTGPTDLTAAQVVAARQEDSADTKTLIERVMKVLKDVLADGPLEAKAARRQVHDGIVASDRTIDEARRQAAVEAHRQGFGKGGRWYWSLPHRTQDEAIDRSAPGNADYGETVRPMAVAEPRKWCPDGHTCSLPGSAAQGDWRCCGEAEAES